MIWRLSFGLGLALLGVGLSLLAPLRAQVGPLPGMAVLPPPRGPVGCGAPVVTNIGTATAPGTAVSITGVTVPASSLIVLLIDDDSSGSLATPTDGHNAYTAAFSGLPLGIFFATNASLSAATISYTPPNPGNGPVIMSAFYASNIATSSPQDAAVTAHGSGTTGAVSITSGTPAQSGELFVASAIALIIGPTVPTFTQDTTNGWSSPPNNASTTNSGESDTLGPGAQVNASLTTKTFAPTFGGHSIWSGEIVGFKHC